MMTRSWLGCLFGASAAVALVAACGSSGESETGFRAATGGSGASGGASGAGGAGGMATGGTAGAGADAGIAWPDADTRDGSDPGPTPEFDAAPPAPFSCPARPEGPGTRTLRLDHDGLSRTALVHVPASYDPTAGTMLVLNFHGFSSAGWQEELLTGMSAAADRRNFIVVYPEGVVTSWNAGDCCGTAWVDGVDDVGFVRKLITRLEADYCIDPKRIYATGMSNGGFISHRLGCELSDKIAAIAPVAGVLGIDPNACVPPRAVPELHFHGTSDPLVPYGGGTPVIPQLGVGIVFRSVADTTTHWRTHNGCSALPQVVFQGGDTTCERYGGCRDGADVILCTVQDGGHTWPGGLPIPMGKTTQAIDATETMLDFFAAHPMP